VEGRIVTGVLSQRSCTLHAAFSKDISSTTEYHIRKDSLKLQEKAKAQIQEDGGDAEDTTEEGEDAEDFQDAEDGEDVADAEDIEDGEDAEDLEDAEDGEENEDGEDAQDAEGAEDGDEVEDGEEGDEVADDAEDFDSALQECLQEGMTEADDACAIEGDCSDDCLNIAAATLESCCKSLGDSSIFPLSAIAQCNSYDQSEPILDNVLECSLPGSSSSSSNPFGSINSVSSMVAVPAVGVVLAVVVSGLLRRVSNSKRSVRVAGPELG